jgi:hypothetical protein
MAGYSNMIVSELNNSTAIGYASIGRVFGFLNPDAATRIVITEKYKKPKLKHYPSNVAIGRYSAISTTAGICNTTMGYQSFAEGTNSSSYYSVLGNGRK